MSFMQVESVLPTLREEGWSRRTRREVMGGAELGT